MKSTEDIGLTYEGMSDLAVEAILDMVNAHMRDAFAYNYSDINEAVMTLNEGARASWHSLGVLLGVLGIDYADADSGGDDGHTNIHGSPYAQAKGMRFMCRDGSGFVVNAPTVHFTASWSNSLHPVWASTTIDHYPEPGLLD